MIPQVSVLMIIMFMPVICLVNSIGKFPKRSRCGSNLDFMEYFGPYKADVHCKPDLRFEAFEPIDVNTCTDWFLDGYYIELVNEIDGTLNVTLLLSPSFSYEKVQYDVKLILTNYSRSSSNFHSTKSVSVDGRTNTSCQKVLILSFPFLFSGSYILKVVRSDENAQNVTISSACASKEFYIRSKYVKKILHNLTPTFAFRHVPQQRELIFITKLYNFSTGQPPHSAIVKLNSNVNPMYSDCSGSGNEVAEYALHGLGGSGEECCTAKPEKPHCPCQWNSNSGQIECKFTNIPNGNYCITLEFYDPRCKALTIWTKGASAYCLWSSIAVLNGSASSTLYKTEVDEQPSSNLHIILPCLFIFVVLVVSVSVGAIMSKSKCSYKFRRGFNDYTTNSLISQTSESSTISWSNKEENCLSPEVLLLYPRDCDAFMNAMTYFRTFLNYNNYKVYDPWDETMYDEVVESCETWMLPFFRNDDVKIILVLSESSKKFEEAFLSNTTLSYMHPRSLDVIFPQSLSIIHQYFACRFDSYQRIFVVRLDGSFVASFDFITPSKLYTLPEGITNLMRDLSRGVVKGLNCSRELPFRKFSEAITEYKNYKINNTGYLDDILNRDQDEKAL